MGQVDALRNMLADITPTDLTVADRLALIDLLQRCLDHDRQQSALAAEGTAPQFVKQFISAEFKN